MRESQFTVVEIDESDRDTFLRRGYNPMSKEDNADDYRREWYGVYSCLEKALSGRWRGGIGDGDFFIDSDWVPDRLLCVEVLNANILVPELIDVVHKVVVASPVAYCIDICNSWLHLKTFAGGPHPDFNIFIEQKRVLAYAKAKELLVTLGLSS